MARIRHIQLPANSTSRTHLEDYCIHHGTQLTSTTSAADWDTAILLAELGLGHAVVPALPGWADSDHPVLRLIPIATLPPLAAGWAARRWDALSPITQEFARMAANSLTRTR